MLNGKEDEPVVYVEIDDARAYAKWPVSGYQQKKNGVCQVFIYLARA